MQRIQCEVCGSDNIVRNGKVFICLNCGCKFLPDSEYELSYLQEEDIPSIEEILSHKGLNPVVVKKDYRGVITIIDEYSGETYTADEYRARIYSLTHKPPVIKRMFWAISDFFSNIRYSWDFNWNTISKAVLIAVIPVFLILGVLSIRNKEPFALILFQFLIAAEAAFHLGICSGSIYSDGKYALGIIGMIIHIPLNHFIIWGSLFGLEFIWRLIIGIILKITCYAITVHIAEK